MKKIGLNKNDIKIGKKVFYYSWVDDEHNHSEPQEAVITSEPYEMCGTVCCKIDICKSVVDIENLSER